MLEDMGQVKPVRAGSPWMCLCDISLRSDPVSGIKINRFLTPTLPSPLRSYSREQPFFLQLKDYFWVKTPSLYELPYGTKGSGKCLPWGAGWVGMVASPSRSLPSTVPVPKFSARLRPWGQGREGWQPSERLLLSSALSNLVLLQKICSSGC